MRFVWLAVLASTVVVVGAAALEGRLGAATGYGVVGLVLTWWLSPWQGGSARTSHAEVTSRPLAERPVVIYWRPGCMFCARLRARLGRAGRRAAWVNIWQDEDAAAYVRGVNDGNETVPTVVLDGHPVTNPAPALVLDRLTAR